MYSQDQFAIVSKKSAKLTNTPQQSLFLTLLDQLHETCFTISLENKVEKRIPQNNNKWLYFSLETRHDNIL